MKTYIAILRGINVSGRNIIKMDALRIMMINEGFSNVTTYIQSGNIIFQYKKTAEEKIAHIISGLILQHFSLSVPALVIKKDALIHIVENHPFLNKCKDDLSKIHVTLMSDNPGTLADNLPHDTYLPDEFCIEGKTVYLYCPNGYGNTKLNNTFFENKLKTTATTRNMKTMQELVNLSCNL
ncbi:MAG: DUF1697 domain-containing protein [Bacteroidota bacterium]